MDKEGTNLSMKIRKLAKRSSLPRDSAMKVNQLYPHLKFLDRMRS